jgi:hypothetical protein
MPTVVTLLTRRREIQAAERAAAPHWQAHTYEGEEIDHMFTTPSGGLVLRQTIAKLVKGAAGSIGIEADLCTHAGRRTVVTTLFVDGDEALEDIARFVGHAKPATTAGYVKRLDRRPKAVAKRAAAVLDSPPGGDREAGQSHGHTPRAKGRKRLRPLTVLRDHERRPPSRQPPRPAPSQLDATPKRAARGDRPY